MEASQVKSWIDVAQGLITILASILGGFWIWSRFILERGLLPPSQMDLGLQTAGSSDRAHIVQIEVSIKNKGSSALVVSDLRLKLRYLVRDDSIEIIHDSGHPAYGRLAFPHVHQLEGAVSGGRAKGDDALGPGEVRIVPFDTFVQP